MFFGLHHSVHRHLTQLLVVQRKQAFDHGRVLLANYPLATFRCHRESVLERRFSAFVALKRYITKPHALKEVGHIHRTDQFVDLMPVRAVAAAIAETGATSIKEMGAVMKAVMPRLAGKNADGRAVSETVKKKLTPVS